MNILVPDSWLREYLETEATPSDIKHCLSLCGPSVEKINEVNGEVVYEIEITTNRVDMASVYGIAREAKAILPRFGFSAKLNPLPLNEKSVPAKNLPLEISDPHNLWMKLWINGELKQSAKTDAMINDIPTLISFLSEVTTLYPGDLITTGNPDSPEFQEKLQRAMMRK